MPTVDIAQGGHKLQLLQSTEIAGVFHCAWGWVGLFPFPSRLGYSLAIRVTESYTQPMASL